MSSFDAAWDSITKAPFYVQGEPFNRTMSDVEAVPYIYSGGDKSDNPEFWTAHLPDALGYALYGSAMPRRNSSGSFSPYDKQFAEMVGMRETVPTIWRVKNPVDFDYPLSPDSKSDGFREGFFDDGMEIEQIPTDEVMDMIFDLIERPHKINEMEGNSAGWWFDNKDILEHTLNALNRLKTGESGQLDIPHEAIPFTQTAFTDDYGFEVDLDDQDF